MRKKSSEGGTLKRQFFFVKCNSANWSFLREELSKYIQAIRSEAHPTLDNIVKEILGIGRMMEALQSQVLIYFCCSAHISGINLFTMEDVVNGKEVHVIDTGSRKLQRILLLTISTAQSGHDLVRSWCIPVPYNKDISPSIRYVLKKCSVYWK